MQWSLIQVSPDTAKQIYEKSPEVSFPSELKF